MIRKGAAATVGAHIKKCIISPVIIMWMGFEEGYTPGEIATGI